MGNNPPLAPLLAVKRGGVSRFCAGVLKSARPHKETRRDNAMLTALTDADWELVRFYLAPIQPLIDADEVTNIMVNRYDDIWADDLDKGMYKTNLSFQDDAAVAALIEQIANALSQSFDPVKTPIVNARLPDGSRVCATLPAATPQGCTLSIRLHRRRDLDLKGLERAKAINADIRRFLLAAIERGDNLLVSGATNSGKTTLLNALSHAIPPRDRVVVCEDVAELSLHAPNAVQMEAQKGDAGESVTLAKLLATSLRQRPDRIIVGEIREPDAAEVFYQALNTGHRGVCATLHANSAPAALKRLVSLIAGASKLPPELIESECLRNLNLFLHIDFMEEREIRRLTAIYAAAEDGLKPLFTYDMNADAWTNRVKL